MVSVCIDMVVAGAAGSLWSYSRMMEEVYSSNVRSLGWPLLMIPRWVRGASHPNHKLSAAFLRMLGAFFERECMSSASCILRT